MGKGKDAPAAPRRRSPANTSHVPRATHSPELDHDTRICSTQNHKQKNKPTDNGSWSPSSLNDRRLGRPRPPVLAERRALTLIVRGQMQPSWGPCSRLRRKGWTS